MKCKFVIAALAMLPMTVFAASEYRTLILQAMNSKSGTSSSFITGKVADQIRGQINKPHAQVMAEVTTLEKLPQEGCKRMQVRITTPGTLLLMDDGKSRMLDMRIELNMCENGMPPG